jgi:hypothetical protein
MPRRQDRKLDAATDQERVRTDKQGLGPLARNRFEDGFNLADAASLDGLNLQPEGGSGSSISPLPQKIDAGRIAVRARKARGQAELDRVVADPERDGNRVSVGLMSVLLPAPFGPDQAEKSRRD